MSLKILVAMDRMARSVVSPFHLLTFLVTMVTMAAMPRMEACKKRLPIFQ